MLAPLEWATLFFPLTPLLSIHCGLDRRVALTQHMGCLAMIPAFGGITGYLPKGVHHATWQEVEAKLAFSDKRKDLLEGLRQACHALRTAGVTHLYLDGSFSSKRHNPGDWDGCYSGKGVNSALLDPVLLDYSNERAAMKNKYKGEVFVAEAAADILGTPYKEFFQKCKNTGRPKGIIYLDLGTVP